MFNNTLIYQAAKDKHQQLLSEAERHQQVKDNVSSKPSVTQTKNPLVRLATLYL